MPRALDYRPDAKTGFIVLIDNGIARIVADGLGYTNECALSADERFLFVNETFARRLTRFSIGDDGSLTSPVTIATFGAGTFPDGLALDAAGGFWVTSIVSNRVIHVRQMARRRWCSKRATLITSPMSRLRSSAARWGGRISMARQRAVAECFQPVLWRPVDAGGLSGLPAGRQHRSFCRARPRAAASCLHHALGLLAKEVLR